MGEIGLCLGQVATEAKSNEITAIPPLLSRLELASSIVSIDAMGCQTEIVEQIDRAHGIDVIAVKDNQPKLRTEIEVLVSAELETTQDDLMASPWRTSEKSHGRLDERSYGVVRPKRGSPLHERWPSVKAIG